MPTMADAVYPANLPPGCAAYAGYIDGAVSKWPDTAWGRFTVPTLTISVLANPSALAFDVEPGNAGATAVALAVRARMGRALPSVVYTDEATSIAVRDAMLAKAVPWFGAKFWPAPGAYLWPTLGNAGAGAGCSWAWVQPVAVQDRWLGAYDLSTLYTSWLPVLTRTVPVPPSVRGKVQTMVIIKAPNGAAYAVSGGKLAPLTSDAEVQAAITAGIPVWQLSDQGQFDALVRAWS